MSNISLPTTHQWQKVLKAIVFSFLSTLLAAVIAAGGIQSTWEATFALASAGAVSGANAALYTLYITLFEEAK